MQSRSIIRHVSLHSYTFVLVLQNFNHLKMGSKMSVIKCNTLSNLFDKYLTNKYQLDITITFQNFIWHVSGWNVGRATTCPEVFRFPQTLQENAGITPRLSRNGFLPNPLELKIHQSFYHRRYTLRDTAFKRGHKKERRKILSIMKMTTWWPHEAFYI